MAKGKSIAAMDAALGLFGSSEMADRPIMSNARNLSDPYVSQMQNVTNERLEVLKELATEGVGNSA